MSLKEFLELPPEEMTKFEVNRTGCNNTKLLSVSGHSVGTLHTLCKVCKTCHDCDGGNKLIVK